MTIICPNCNKTVDISEAMSHAYESEFAEKTKLDIEQATKLAETKALKKAEEEMELRLKDKDNEAEEAKDRNRKLQEQLLDLTRSMRELKEKDENRALESEKKLNEEREKIQIEAQKKAEEGQYTKLLEKDKQLQDALKEAEEMKRKLQQGSQQTQGEAFELEFEESLAHRYGHDKITPVAKGVKGGDIVQEVYDSYGNYAGKILWELKNTKTWSELWVDKLKGDKRAISADDAVLISEVLPNDLKIAGFRNQIWVTSRQFVIPLADALRAKLIHLQMVRKSAEGKDQKVEMLYQYLTGPSFLNRMEAIIDAFTNMQKEVEKEKRYFASKWARDEKSIRMVLDNTFGMHGDLKSLMGTSLPEMKSLEITTIETIETEESKVTYTKETNVNANLIEPDVDELFR